MAVKRFLAVIILVLLAMSCSRENNTEGPVIDTIILPASVVVSADEGSADIEVRVTGRDYAQVEPSMFDVYLTAGVFSGIRKVAPGNFVLTVSSLTSVAFSPVDLEVTCCGKKAYGRIIIEAGAPASIKLDLSTSVVSADDGTVSGSFTVTDKRGNPIYFEGVTVSASYGEISSLWREGDSYHFIVSGLTDVGRSPVVITVTAGNIKESREVEILVGKLARFCVDEVESPQIVNVPFQLHIRACDRSGNLYTAFNDRVNIDADIGEVEPGVSGRFENGERVEEIMIHQEAAGERVRVSYGGIVGFSNPFDVNPQPASRLTIDADRTLISADDPGVELTIKLENDQGYGIAGKPIKVELLSADGRKLDDSGSSYGMVSSVLDNGDGTYTCFITELRNVEDSPYVVRATMASLEDEIQISVVPGEMNHFKIDEIPSQRASFPFLLNFIASDQWGNRVYVYSGKVTISAECGNPPQECPVQVNDASSNPYFPGNNVLYGQSIPGITLIFPSDYDSARVIVTDGHYTGVSNEFKVFGAVMGTGVIPNTNYVVSGYRFFVVFDTADIPPDGSCDFNSLPDRIVAGEPFKFYIVARYYAVDPNNPSDTACYQTGIYDTGNPFDGNVWIGDSTGSMVLLGSSYEHLSPDFPVTPSGSILNPVYEKYIEVTAAIQDTSDNATILINPTLRSGVGSGSSSGFAVLPGDVDHIRIDTIDSPQIAGSEFNLRAVAEDRNGNLVPLDLQVTLTDKSGTISPTTAYFRDGRLSVNVLITTVMSGDTITIDGGDAHTLATSNPFDVISDLAVDHFDVRILSDPANIRAGVPVTYEVVARNPAGNVVDSFNYSVSITDLTGSISPNRTARFQNGYLKDSFVIMRTASSDRIFITGGGARGVSEEFSVGAGALDHFEIDAIDSPQYVNNPFYITIRAIDVGGNLKDDYEGYHPIRIADRSGNVEPSVATANFSGGILYQQVKVTDATINDIIFVGDENGHSGASNSFDVVFGALSSIVCETPRGPVAGYPFHFYCTAYDSYGNVKGDYTKDVTTDTTRSGTAAIVSDDAGCMVKMTGGFVNGEMDAVMRATKSCPTNDYLTVSDGGVSGQTDWFNIYHDTIYFTISPIPDQVKGVPFTFNVKVTDESGYLYNYYGALEISDLTSTIEPVVTDNFNGSSINQEVKIDRIADADRIILGNYQETVTVSNAFAVHGPPLGSIVVQPVEDRQLVDYPFTVRMVAYDIYGNVKEDYNGSVDMDDVTGTLEVVGSTSKSVSFEGGYAVTDVVIHAIRPDGDDRLIVSYTTNYGSQVTYSNYFSVEERRLDHFVIDTIPDQSQYIVFYITVRGVDLKGNVYENFNGSVYMEDLSGTLTPTESNTFTSGILTDQKVRIDQLYNGDQIHVYAYDNGVTVEGYSNYFNVGASPVRSIYFDPISDQTQNVPFLIHMKALDINGNVVPGFEGKVALSAVIGFQNVITPTESDNFINGEIYQTVVITEASPSFLGNYLPITINANLPGVGVFSSNPFVVYPE